MYHCPLHHGVQYWSRLHIQLFPFLRGYQKISKTVKNPQSLQLFFLGVSSSSKNHQKMSKTLREYSYFLFLRGYQKPSKIVKIPQSLQSFLFFEGYLAPPKTIKNIQNPQSIQVFPLFEGLSKTVKYLQKPSKTVNNRQKPLQPTIILVF